MKYSYFLKHKQAEMKLEQNGKEPTRNLRNENVVTKIKI